MSEWQDDDRWRQAAVELLSKVPFAAVLGISIVCVRPGKAVLSLEVRDDLKQNQGIVHGGAIASLIDTAAAIAVATVMEDGETSSTVDLTVHYLRSLSSGKVEAHASIQREGRNIIVISVDVQHESSEKVAMGTLSFLRVRRQG